MQRSLKCHASKQLDQILQIGKLFAFFFAVPPALRFCTRYGPKGVETT